MDDVTLIYPDKDRMMRVVVLFSGGASGAKYLLEEGNMEGPHYKIVAGFTDHQDSSGIEVFRRRNLPVRVIEKNILSKNQCAEGDTRPGYFDRLTIEVKRFEPDLILLSGFMQVVKPPLLTEYSRKIINVHPADLTVKEEGKRKYTGDDAVYDTLLAGETVIRSTVHLVTEGVDQGEIIVLSKIVPIEQDMVQIFEKFNSEMIRKYSDVLQEWMKWSCDGPSIHKALSLISTGKVGFSGEELRVCGEGGFVNGCYDLETRGVVS